MTPEPDFLNPALWAYLARGIPITLQLTIFGFLIGAVLGLPLMLARRSRVAPVRWVARAYIEVFRGVPIIVWLFMIYQGSTQFDPNLQNTFTSMNSAILGFGLVSAAYMAEIYRGCLGAVHAGQYEAGFALGMSTRAVNRAVIWPQMFRIAIPASASYMVGLLKDTSVAVTIGCTEILWYARNATGNITTIQPYLVAGLMFIALTLLAAFGSRRLDSVLRKRVAR
jgi:polar amino acid transport system permease protein